MTNREAVVISAYTGILMSKYSLYHKYVEELLGRPVYTDELCSEKIHNTIKDKAKDEFVEICSNVKS